ncbi:MAG: CPXCG motif-containing cysteine-rich protein [Gammaproteobacteria bacterium]|nr:CPXCG motif-containing cysteine-rich protein [Gammaproteobacteria bacterium]
MSFAEEHYYSCPYCGEAISSVLDLSAPEQRYIEDCEVCCQPIEIAFQVIDGQLALFSAARGDD